MECLRALALLCLCGSVLGVLDIPSRSTKIAAIQTEHNEPHSLFMALMDVLRTCTRPFTVSNTSDVTPAQLFCASLPAIRQCLTQEGTKWKEAYGEKLHKVFQIYHDFWETNTDRICAKNAEKLTPILQEFQKFSNIFREGNNPFLIDCFFYGGISLQTVDTSKADTASKVWFFYHQVQTFRECLARTLFEYETFVSLVVEQINTARVGMKCLDPQNDSIVACSSVDSSLIDRAAMCPLQPEQGQSTSEALVSKAFSCLDSRNYLGPKLSDAHNLEQFQTFFKRHCGRDSWVKNGLSETGIAADICLNEADFGMFKLVKFYLEVVNDASCFEEGRRLATVLYTMYVTCNTTNEPTWLPACLGPHLATGSGTMDVYHYYQQLPEIQRCLLDSVPGNTAFQSDVLEIIKEISDKAKCLNPKSGKVVLCKDIVH